MNLQARHDGYKQAYEQNVARFDEPKPKFDFGDRVRINGTGPYLVSDEYAIIDVHQNVWGEYTYDVVTTYDFDNYAYQDFVLRVNESQLKII